MKKRGAAHVGIVLSFIIFITFLIFIYSILIQPAISQNSKQSVLENLKIKLTEEISKELILTTINIVDKPENCIRLTNFINDIGINSELIVKNKLNNKQTSYVLGNDLEISRSNVGDTLFKIYYSEEFSGLSNIGENPCDSTTYTKGLIRTNKYVFESSFISLINEYNADYDLVKDKLKVPSGSDFGFGFTYGNGTSINAIKNVTTNIYALEIPTQYVNKESDILLGFLNIRVW